LPSVFCNYYESSDHAAYHCPYHAYVDATCVSIERKINELTDQMVETMKKRIAKYYQCFNQCREHGSERHSSLGYPEPVGSLDYDFHPSYQSKPHLNENMPLPNLEQQSDLPTSLSPT